jgi:hypothetical protein
MKTVAVMADITFNMATGDLTGTFDGWHFRVHASAGGRTGSTTPGVIREVLVNNPFATQIKKPDNVDIGYAGPLPMGRYTLKPHETLPNRIRLNPDGHNVMYNRGSFLIHCHGPIGSEGCIVPDEDAFTKSLYKRVVAHQGPPLTLQVEAVGDLDYFERIIREDNHMG